jgi:hypothetical protein
MTINEMIKKLKETFGDDIQYRAVSKDGKVFKTQGFDTSKKSIDSRYKV